MIRKFMSQRRGGCKRNQKFVGNRLDLHKAIFNQTKFFMDILAYIDITVYKTKKISAKINHSGNNFL